MNYWPTMVMSLKSGSTAPTEAMAGMAERKIHVLSTAKHITTIREPIKWLTNCNRKQLFSPMGDPVAVGSETRKDLPEPPTGLSSVPEKFIPVIPTIANCNTAMLTVINGWQPSVTFLSVRVGSIIRKKTAVWKQWTNWPTCITVA